MPVSRLSPSQYRRFTFAALVVLVAIIITGAAVRLSGSGLGCDTWPQCEQGKLIGASNSHQLIEQVNRLFTGLIVIVIMLAVGAALIRQPRRRDLTRLAVALIVGVLFQAVVGGAVVLTDLHPAAVMWHYLLSGICLVGGVVLHRRASEHGAPYQLTVPIIVRRHVLAIAAFTTVAVVTGTLTTGTGPHSGVLKETLNGEEVPVAAKRFDIWDLTSIARLHSITVIVTLILLVLLMLRVRQTPAWKTLEAAIEGLLVTALLQGGIGYMQWLNELPALLVGFHIAGSTAVIVMVTRLVLATRASASERESLTAR